MKKRIFIFVLSAIFAFVFMQFASAGYIGISPGLASTYFSPYLNQTWTFKIIGSDASNAEVYVAGDLAQYAHINQKFFKENNTFDVILNLPAFIEVPGKHRLYVGAREHMPEGVQGMGGRTVVQAVINVFVPYPGKYAEAVFDISNANDGEPVNYSLNISNLGTEDITAKISIDLYKVQNRIKTIELNDTIIPSNTNVYILGDLNESLEPGRYNVAVTVDYGGLKPINFFNEFRVGELFVNITDYSYQFMEKKVDRFYVEVENLWNDEVDNVYVSMGVTSNGTVIGRFLTPSVNLQPWEKTNLSGYFDAENVSAGRYLAGINLSYGNQSTYKVVAIYLLSQPKKIDWVTILIVIAGILFLAFLAMIYILIKIIKSKNGKKKKRLK